MDSAQIIFRDYPANKYIISGDYPTNKYISFGDYPAYNFSVIIIS